MTRSYFTIWIWVLMSAYSVAHEIKGLLPWLEIDGIRLGASIAEFRERRPEAKPLFDVFDETEENDYSGVLFEGEINDEGKAETEMLSFKFNSGILTGVSWEDNTHSWNEKLEARGRVSNVAQKIRNLLLEIHGEPQAHQIVKIQFNEDVREEAIAIVDCDLFKVRGSEDLRITLTASSTGIRVALLDMPEEKIAEFFSIQKDVERLKEKGLRELEDDEVIDHLKAIKLHSIGAADRKLDSQVKNSTRRSEERDLTVKRDIATVKEISESKKSFSPLIIAGVLLLGILLLLFKTFKRKSTS